MATTTNTVVLTGGVPLQTNCNIHSSLSNTVILSSSKNWSGKFEDGAPPKNIQPSDVAQFFHFASKGKDGASKAGVAYKEVNDHQFVLAWNNPTKLGNQAFTMILKPGEDVNWTVVEGKLEKSSNQCTATLTDDSGTYTSTVDIDKTGGTPTFTAQMEFEPKK